MVEGTVAWCYGGGYCTLPLLLKSSSGGSRIRQNDRKNVRLMSMSHSHWVKQTRNRDNFFFGFNISKAQCEYLN